jgi:hypothetical protein
MPHDSPWLNDYQLKLKADELQRKSEEDKVFNTQNAALRAAINCPLPLRKPSDCRNCGNEECVNAYKEQNKLWPENACDEPAFPANTTSTPQAAAISPAKSRSPATTKCPAPGQPASGSGLFDLIPNDEEKAA